MVAICAMLSLTACEGKGLSDGGIFAEDIKPASSVKIVDETKTSSDMSEDIAESTIESSGDSVADMDAIIDVTDGDTDSDGKTVVSANDEEEGFFSSIFGSDNDEEESVKTIANKEEKKDKTLVSWLFGDEEDDVVSKEEMAMSDEDLVKVPEIPLGQAKQQASNQMGAVDKQVKDTASRAKAIMDEGEDEMRSSVNRVNTTVGQLSIDDRAAQLRAELLGDLQDAEDTRSEFLGTPRKQVSFDNSDDDSMDAEDMDLSGKVELEERDIDEVALVEPDDEDDIPSAPLSEEDQMFADEQAEISPEIDEEDPEKKREELERLAAQDESSSLIARLIAEDKRKQAKELVSSQRLGSETTPSTTDAVVEAKPVVMRAPRWTRTPSEEQATNLLARLQKEKKDITRVVSPDIEKIDEVLAEAEALTGSSADEARERAKYVDVRDLYKVTKTNNSRSILPDVSDKVVDELSFDAANRALPNNKVDNQARAEQKSIIIDPKKLAMLPSRISEAEKIADERISSAIAQSDQRRNSAPTMTDQAIVPPVPVGQVTASPISLLDNKTALQSAQNSVANNESANFLERTLQKKAKPEDQKLEGALPVYQDLEVQQSAEPSVVADVQPVFPERTIQAGGLRSGSVVRADKGSLSMMSSNQMLDAVVPMQANDKALLEQKTTSEMPVQKMASVELQDNPTRLQMDKTSSMDPVLGSLRAQSLNNRGVSTAPAINTPVAQSTDTATPVASNVSRQASSAPLSQEATAPMFDNRFTQQAQASNVEEEKVALAQQLMQQAQALLGIETPADISDKAVIAKKVTPDAVEVQTIENTARGAVNVKNVEVSIPEGQQVAPPAIPVKAQDEFDYGALGNTNVASVDTSKRKSFGQASLAEMTKPLPSRTLSDIEAPAQDQRKVVVYKSPIDAGNASMDQVQPENDMYADSSPISLSQRDEMVQDEPYVEPPKLDQFARSFDDSVQVYTSDDSRKMQEPVARVEEFKPSPRANQKPSLDRFRQSLEQADRMNGMAGMRREDIDVYVPTKHNSQDMDPISRELYEETIGMGQAPVAQAPQQTVQDQAPVAVQQPVRQKRIVVQPEYYYVPVQVPAPQPAPQQMAMNMGQQQFNANQRMVNNAPQMAQQPQYSSSVPDYRRPVRRRATDNFVSRGSTDAAKQRVQMTAEELARVNLNMQNRGSNPAPAQQTQSQGQTDGSASGSSEAGQPQPFSKF